jgi:glycosyltransferase involved in cell wall biosynthesis
VKEGFEGPRPAVVMLAGIRWSFLWQRHQELATRFARAGYPTTFVETTGLSNPRPSIASVRNVFVRIRGAGRATASADEPNLSVYAPLVAPPTLALFRFANRKVFVPRVARDLRRLAGPDPIVVAYPPTRTTLDLVREISPRLLLYDRSDDYGEFPSTPKDIGRTEHELLRAADLVSCTSTTLLSEIRALRPDAFYAGPGVDFEAFAPLRSDRREGTRTVCYFGHLSAERLDFAVLEALARAGYRVRLVGGVGRMDRRLLNLPGVDYRGEVPHGKLPGALSGVDAFVLPYRVNALTRTISPAKTFECLATGKPVVSAPIPAMVELEKYVYLARAPTEYVQAVDALEHSETERKRQGRVEAARRASWGARFAEIEERLWSLL